MGFHITIATDADSWFNEFVPRLEGHFQQLGHQVSVVHNPREIPRGEIAFLLSLGQIVPADVRKHNVHNVVVHASALPLGKGWSPVTWQVIEGKNIIPLTLFEAVDSVDAGPIYLTGEIKLDGTELVNELRVKQALATIDLCREFVDHYPTVISNAREQDPSRESFYPRRGPEHSRLDPDQSIREQFNLIRACDPDRYPAFFEIDGNRYVIRLERSTSRADGQ